MSVREMIGDVMAGEGIEFNCAKPTIQANTGVKNPEHEGYFGHMFRGAGERSIEYQKRASDAVYEAQKQVRNDGDEAYKYTASLGSGPFIATDNEEDYLAWLKANEGLSGVVTFVHNGGADPDNDIGRFDIE